MSRFFDRVFRGVEILMAVFLATMVLLMFLNVILRFGFSSGFVWSEEITRLCFIYLVYFGTVAAFRDNQHLGVDTLIDKVPPFIQKILYTVVQLIIIWVMWLLAQGSFDLAVQNLNNRWVATQFPRALIDGVGVVTGGAIALIALGNLYRLLVQKRPVSELLAIREEETSTTTSQID